MLRYVKASNKGPLNVDGTMCTVCMICQMVCALKFTRNSFNISESAIRLKRTERGTCEIEFAEKCDDCGLCVRYCSYGALTWGEKEGTEASYQG